MKNIRRKNLVKITLSMALISAMGLGGCKSGSGVTQNDTVQNGKTQNVQTNQNQGYNTVTGKVSIRLLSMQKVELW